MAVGCDLTINFLAKANDLLPDNWLRPRGEVRVPVDPQRFVAPHTGEQHRMEPLLA